MTDGLTLNFLVLGDDADWAEVLDTITDHVASLVREETGDMLRPEVRAW